MEGLGSAQYCGQGLNRHSYDIVFWLLGRQGRATGLGMEFQHHGFFVLGMESFLHDLGPNPSCCPVLGNFFKKVIMGIKKEGQPRRKPIHIQPGLYGCIDIGNPIGKGKGHFLGRRRTCFSYVVARDGNGVPLGHTFGAVFKYIIN